MYIKMYSTSESSPAPTQSIRLGAAGRRRIPAAGISEKLTDGNGGRSRMDLRADCTDVLTALAAAEGGNA
jgi:hypothetical protein